MMPCALCLNESCDPLLEADDQVRITWESRSHDV